LNLDEERGLNLQAFEFYNLLKNFFPYLVIDE